MLLNVQRALHSKTVDAQKGVRSSSYPFLCIYYLIGVSVVFYGMWSLEHLFILLSSVGLNYGFAVYFSRHSKQTVTSEQTVTSPKQTVFQQKGVRSSSYPLLLKNYLYVVVGLNLLPLVYYKYSNFLSMSEHSLILPLAISFFTFQQIAFQVDLYRGKIELDGFDKYMFFVLFFPQLVAGPIVHYGDLVGQIGVMGAKKATQKGVRSSSYPLLGKLFSTGVLLFSIGLFKKVVLADSLSIIANNSFGTTALSSYDAWLGVFAYSFQIYFDFSGYADMAIGLALLFGFRLPVNFLSPYKSRNIVEFWRSWHITLSNFLRDYIYIPLGGNRVGAFRGVANILITMLIGGIWHGAGWTFVLWGFLHGVFLGVVHFVGLYHNSRNKEKGVRSSSYPFLSISTVITFLVVTLLWVLFRSESLEFALNYYKVLFEFKEFSLNMDFNELLLLVSLIIVWFFPNSKKFAKYFEDKPTLSVYHSLVGAVMFFVSLKMMAMAPAKTFVYFNF